jgi:hypothetical protein
MMPKAAHDHRSTLDYRPVGLEWRLADMLRGSTLQISFEIRNSWHGVTIKKLKLVVCVAFRDLSIMSAAGPLFKITFIL